MSLVLGRTVFAALIALSAWAFLAPVPDVPPGPLWAAGVVHVAIFAALYVTGRWAGARAMPLVVVLAGYAVATELAQGALPFGRTAAVSDVVADLVGLLLGVLAVLSAAWTPVGSRS